MIDLNKAQSLCSKSEWNLVKSSFARLPETDAILTLKSKISAVKELHRKCTAMIDLLHSESRITRTRQKIELFAEAIGRLEAALVTSEAAEASAGNADDRKPVMKIPSLDLNTPPDRADSRALAAVPRRGGERVQKSGSTSRSHVGSIPRRQQGRRNSSKNH